MTHFFGLYDPGRSGGSWFARCCNAHPDRAGIIVLGEAHQATQLDFPHPGPGHKDVYDEHIITFFQSQAAQGRAAAGIIKCFHAATMEFIYDNGGRFATLLRNPMELVGCWKGRRGWGQSESRKRLARQAIDHFPPEDKAEEFECLLYEVRLNYRSVTKRAGAGPIVRIEDLNRSLGGDGQFFKAVCEWITQVPFPGYYIDLIRKWYFPGHRYSFACIRDERGAVVGTMCIPSRKPARHRMTWADDPAPAKWWNEWTDQEKGLFREYLGELCEQLGYNCTTSPGFVDLDWPLKGKYSWAKEEKGLKPIE